MLSKQCVVEITELSRRAETLSRGSTNERKQADVLLQRIGNLKQVGLSSDEIRAQYADGLLESLTPRTRPDDAAYHSRFERYIAGKLDDAEFRDFLAGQQTIYWTQGVAGGYLVPFAYDSLLRESMSQVDPLLDENVCDFSMTNSGTLLAEQVSGYDLTVASGQLVGESVQQNPQAIPSVAGATLRSNLIFKASFAASIEAETDIPDFSQKITRAVSVALARTIGQHVLTGRGGSTDIVGIATQSLSSSVTNATQGTIVLGDLNKIYFGVNRWYRAAKKAAWLMNDGAYKLVRAAVDNQGRPLLNIERDGEVLFGKPVYVSPSLGILASIGVTGAIIFGDLGHIVVRSSRPAIQRAIQLGQADITKGECLYIGRARCDATLFDPSNGVFPPVILATVN